jgi:erythromycin esterase-like protein
MIATLGLLSVFATENTWLKSNAIPLSASGNFSQYEDLKKLKPMLDGARIVGMGEATHGTREFFETKHRMFRFLVEEMGFRVFILEASMAGCLMMDDYVLGKKVDLKKAIRQQGFWTWSVAELKELLEWMREYNRTHEEKLRVFGNDMQNPEDPMMALNRYEAMFRQDKDKGVNLSGLGVDSKSDIDSLVERVRKQKGDAEAEKAQLIATTLFQSHNNNWERFLRSQQQEVVPMMPQIFPDAGILLKEVKDPPLLVREALKFVDEHKEQYVEPSYNEGEGLAKLKSFEKALSEFKASDEATQKRIQAQAKLFQFLIFVSTMPSEMKGITVWRDYCMAKNTTTIIEKLVPGAKAMIWAHNGHIGRLKNSMGSYIHEQWKAKYYPLGFSFSEGSFRAVENGKLKVCTAKNATSPLEVFFSSELTAAAFVPLAGQKELPTELRSIIKSRQIGAIWNSKIGNQFVMEFSPAVSFDGMFYFPKTTAARALN